MSLMLFNTCNNFNEHQQIIMGASIQIFSASFFQRNVLSDVIGRTGGAGVYGATQVFFYFKQPILLSFNTYRDR